MGLSGRLLQPDRPGLITWSVGTLAERDALTEIDTGVQVNALDIGRICRVGTVAPYDYYELINVVVSPLALTWGVLSDLSKSRADSAYAPKLQHNAVAADPAVNDDASAGYSVRSSWINTATGEIFSCIDTTEGAAVWVKTSLTLDDLGAAATKSVTGNGAEAVTGAAGVNGNLLAWDAGGNAVDAGKATADVLETSHLEANGGNIPQINNAAQYTKQQNFTATSLTDGASIAWDLDSNQVADVTLAGNRTLANPTNMVNGGTYILRVIQDATGGRTLAYGGGYKWAGGAAPILSTAPNAVDLLTFYSDGTSMYGVPNLGFS